MKQTLFSLCCVLFALFTSCKSTTESTVIKPNPNVFCFYYNWYGNTQYDGKEIHWAHPVLKKSPTDPDMPGTTGGKNISSNFYPKLGNYSSNDPKIIAQHMQMMADSGIGVVVLTWWRDTDSGLEAVPTIMKEAAKRNLKVCFHLEPYGGRCAKSVRDDLTSLIKTYGEHPAFYRINGKPCFFIYDSYLTKAEEWATLLKKDGEISIRNTAIDACMIGLWVGDGEEPFFENSGFDGYYTYFASENFTYGSSPKNWKYMQSWAEKHDKIFIPCLGPGYIDTRVRPWNGSTTKSRENGKYYDRMFSAVIESGSPFVGITSFNEWHEGTQIEPAVPFECKEFKYLDYGSLEPDYYLKRTAYWVSKLKK